MTDLILLSELSSLLELAGRATIVFGVALALAWLIRKGSATARHQLWTLTFLLLLALPVLTLLGPSWDLPLLPSPDRPASVPVPEAAFDAGPFDPGPVDSGAFDRGGPVGASGLPAHVANVEAHTAPGISRLPLLIWAIGCVAAIGSLGAGILRFRKLVRSARPVGDPSWHRQLGAVQDELGLHAHVRLRLGGEVVTPMTGGLWSPVILLPASASGWSAARRIVVLTHELVHVRRRDALRQLLGRVVLALYWFHPLSWVASRLAAASREQACDEDVLAVGQRPSEYARHLVSLAAKMDRRETVLSLPIVHPSQLERRVRAIVRRNRPRRRGLITVPILTALGVAGVTASVANPVPVATTPATTAQPVAAEFVREDCSFASAENWVAKRSLEDAVLCIGVNGEAVVSDDGREVLEISAGGSVELESSGRRRHRLVITQGAGGLEHDWRIDGHKQVFGEEARQWRDLMLVLLRDMAPGLWELGFGQDPGLRRRAGPSWTDVIGVLGQSDMLRAEVAGLLGQMATNRAEELSLRSALTAASNTRTRDALEEEIADRVGRVGDLAKGIEKLDPSALEAAIRQQIEQYDAEGNVRGLERELSDLVKAHLRAERARSGQEDVDALRRLING